MSEQSTSERWIFWMGSRAAIIGALLGGIGNLLHPVTPIGDPEGVARVIAESEIWVPVHLGIVFGLILMLGGLVAIYHSISEGAAGALVRFGLVAAIAGATVGVIDVILDGVAAKHLANLWAAAPADEKALVLGLVMEQETFNFALAIHLNVLFAGITFILYGLAVAFSDVYPRWLGWVVVIAGLGSIGAGLIQAYAGEPTPITRILTIIGPTVITLWLLVMGILLARKEARL